MAKVVQAFVARSFAESDAARIKPLIDFLGTFETLGFICIDAEPAEAELVSEKIQSLISECDVFIAVFTQKYPVFGKSWTHVFDFLKWQSAKWSAPSWVLQESGFALGRNKKLVFYVEEGVEVPELQGDHERIHFSTRDFDPAFKRTNEMIHRIIRDHLAIEVATVVLREVQTVQAPPAQEVTPDRSTEPPQEPSIYPFVIDLFESIQKGDVDLQRKAYEGGLEHARKHKPDIELLWKTFYQRERAKAGYTDALAELKELQRSHPDSQEPLASLGNVFQSFEDYDKAAENFRLASDLTKGEESVALLNHSASCLILAKKFTEAREGLLHALSIAGEQQRPEILTKIYETYEKEAKEIEAIGVAEYSLEENGAQPDLHFSLAYDHSSAFKELAAVHYLAVLDQRSEDDGAMNNVGVCFEGLNLERYAVGWFNDALKRGNHLAAGNLGYRYLNAGFVSDARKAIEASLKEPEPNARVVQCLAEIQGSKDSDAKKYEEIEEIASSQRVFFRRLGDALVHPMTIDPSGDWEFPSCTVRFSLSEHQLSGMGKKAPNRFSGFLGGEDAKEYSYEIQGQFHSRVCEYFLTEKSSKPGIFGPSPSTAHRSGFIAFSANGLNGIVLEKDGSDWNVFQIQKLPQAAQNSSS